MKKFMALSAVLVLAGCPTDDGETGETGDTDMIDTDDTDVEPALALSAELTSGGAVLAITNGMEGEWSFGLVQAGTDNDWTGEDCHTGFTTDSGSNLQYCHPSSNTGVTLTLSDFSGLETSDTNTLFSSALDAGSDIGFIVIDPDGNCYVSGETAAVAHWDSLSCMAFPQ